MTFTLEQLIDYASVAGASDVHLACGLPPKLRIDGSLKSAENCPALSFEDCEAYARQIGGEAFEQMGSCGELDLSFSMNGLRIRGNIFRQQGRASIALRLLATHIPDLDSLGVPKAVLEFPNVQRGIILVTGETGSGKSTTMAALLDRINHTRADHIITLEDPIEYLHTPDRCLINQREIGTDTRSYADALRAVLREDPDVILIGEMRDLDTIETALTAAETGHMVLGTLHTKSAADAIDRMVDVFPSERQRQIRMQVSTCLHAVLAQQLVRRTGGGRVLAAELMVVTPAIRNLIREAKTPQIANALATGASVGSVTMDNSLLELYRSHVIDADTAVEAAIDQEYVRNNTSRW